jgi:hypothetical protein
LDTACVTRTACGPLCFLLLLGCPQERDCLVILNDDRISPVGMTSDTTERKRRERERIHQKHKKRIKTSKNTRRKSKKEFLTLPPAPDQQRRDDSSCRSIGVVTSRKFAARVHLLFSSLKYFRWTRQQALDS